MSGDNPDKKDMTRIEDLSEFLHNDDPEVDRLLSDEEDAFSEEETEVSEMNAFPFAGPDEPEEQVDLESAEEDDDSEAMSFADEELPETPSAGLDDLDDLPDLPESESPLKSDEAESDDDSFSFGEDGNSEDAFSSEDPFGESSDDSEESSFETEDADFSFDSEESEEEDSDENTSEDEEADFESDSFDLSSEDTDDADETIEESEESEEPKDEDDDNEVTEAPDLMPQEEEAQFLSEEIEEPITPTPAPTKFPVRENFEDIKKFANSLSYGDVSSPGNPPFSLVIKDIKYQEDASDILGILREHSLVNDDNEKDFSVGLEQGAVLIGQLSEYSAIYLAHRLRRFDLDISIGLSDEIHPAKSYEREGRGLTTKDQLYQNKKLTQSLDLSPVHPNDIIVATTPTLSGYKIERYIDVITEHVIISDEDLRDASGHQEIPSDVDDEVSSQDELGHDYHIGLSQIYYSLMQDLKPRAHKLGGNAVLGINFSLTSLPGSESYKITCAGNVAWVNNE